MDINYYKKFEPLWGSWYIDKELGKGSFGRVFKIVRNDFDVTYEAALKVITLPQDPSEIQSLKNEGMDDESISHYYKSFINELVKEFALMSKLKGQSNIVSYEDHKVVEHEDKLGWDIFIRMELLTPLTSYLSQKAMTNDDIVKLGIDICNALEACAKQGIIHRDIKPENVFISEYGNFKLGDFGVARTAEKSTQGMSMKGTISYMAPEVYKGEAYNASVDYYSLGMMLYRLANKNRAPFLPPAPAPITFTDREQAESRRMMGEVLPKASDASDGLMAVIAKATAFDYRNRYASALEMKKALQALLTGSDKVHTSVATGAKETDFDDATVMARAQIIDDDATVMATAQKIDDDATVMAVASKVAENVIPESKPVANNVAQPKMPETRAVDPAINAEAPADMADAPARKKSKAPIFIIIGIVCAAVVAGVVIFLVKGTGSSNTSDSSVATTIGTVLEGNASISEVLDNYQDNTGVIRFNKSVLYVDQSLFLKSYDDINTKLSGYGTVGELTDWSEWGSEACQTCYYEANDGVKYRLFFDKISDNSKVVLVEVLADFENENKGATLISDLCKKYTSSKTVNEIQLSSTEFYGWTEDSSYMYAVREVSSEILRVSVQVAEMSYSSPITFEKEVLYMQKNLMLSDMSSVVEKLRNYGFCSSATAWDYSPEIDGAEVIYFTSLDKEVAFGLIFGQLEGKEKVLQIVSYEQGQYTDSRIKLMDKTLGNHVMQTDSYGREYAEWKNHPSGYSLRAYDNFYNNESHMKQEIHY